MLAAAVAATKTREEWVVEAIRQRLAREAVAPKREEPMREILWTVVRFPNGSWSYGGSPDDSSYDQCEKWQIRATSSAAAVKAAQQERYCRMAREKRATAKAEREKACQP